MARRAGVKASAIRYYEETGLLAEPERVGGKRRYGPEVLGRLSLIKAAKRAGFTIGEIHTLFHGFPDETAPPERWRALAGAKLMEVEELISRTRETKRLLEEAFRCECASLDECAALTG